MFYPEYTNFVSCKIQICTNLGFILRPPLNTLTLLFSLITFGFQYAVGMCEASHSFTVNYRMAVLP